MARLVVARLTMTCAMLVRLTMACLMEARLALTFLTMVHLTTTRLTLHRERIQLLKTLSIQRGESLFWMQRA